MSDFEVNETGTVRKLCLTSMALKAALAYVDALDYAPPEHSIIAESREFLDEIRKELPDDYQ